ncbi:9520_t:CDS:2, partial [Racocetra persica]
MTDLILPQLYVYPLTGSQIVSVKKNAVVPYIPPEIIRIILDLLRDDIKTLAACALVNHTFNLHATPILHHTDADITTSIKEYDLITILRSPNTKNFRTLDIGSSQITPLILTVIKNNCPSLQYLVDGWKINANYGRRWYYSRESQKGAIKPDIIHGRKLDIIEYGPEFIS